MKLGCLLFSRSYSYTELTSWTSVCHAWVDWVWVCSSTQSVKSDRAYQPVFNLWPKPVWWFASKISQPGLMNVVGSTIGYHSNSWTSFFTYSIRGCRDSRACWLIRAFCWRCRTTPLPKTTGSHSISSGQSIAYGHHHYQRLHHIQQQQQQQQQQLRCRRCRRRLFPCRSRFLSLFKSSLTFLSIFPGFYMKLHNSVEFNSIQYNTIQYNTTLNIIM